MRNDNDYELWINEGLRRKRFCPVGTSGQYL